MTLPRWAETATEAHSTPITEDLLLKVEFERGNREIVADPPELKHRKEVVREGRCPICGEMLSRETRHVDPLLILQGEIREVGMAPCEPCGWWFGASGTEIMAAPAWWVAERIDLLAAYPPQGGAE